MCKIGSVFSKNETRTVEKSEGSMGGKKVNVSLKSELDYPLLTSFVCVLLFIGGLLLTCFGSGGISGIPFNAALFYSGIGIVSLTALPILFLLGSTIFGVAGVGAELCSRP